MSLKPRADPTTTILPEKAFALEPTGKWDGNDGKWSTFYINVGDYEGANGEVGHGQNFRVLISTSLAVTQLPLQSDLCKTWECASKRGVELFNNGKPLGLNIMDDGKHTWTQEGINEVPMPEWWSGLMERAVNGSWGLSTVGLGRSVDSDATKILAEQRVIGTLTDDLFMGTFGLEITPVGTSASGQTRLTFLDDLRGLNWTSSRSYGYTAGASYWDNDRGALGSLVFGGYDPSRMGKGISIPLAPKDNTLLVGVQNMQYRADPEIDPNQISLTGQKPFSARIDSTLPYLWLPDAVCDEVAERFRLKYDQRTNFYTVDESAHNYNMGQNATITFTLGKNPQGNTDIASVTLPYAAFDLEGSPPLFRNTTKYFPIRKSKTKEYILGRAFLQETYILVDYGRRNFTVAPALFPNSQQASQLVTITDFTVPETSNPSGGGDLSPGAIAGIVVGIVAVIGLLALGGFLFWRKRRQQRRNSEKSHEIDTTQAGDQVRPRAGSELYGSEPPYSPKLSLNGYYDRDGKEINPLHDINEMESPPTELPAGTPQSESTDYFYGKKMRRRGATRESSGHNTPGTPGIGYLAELPGDEGQYTVDGQKFDPVVQHSRGASNTSIPSNIDALVSGSKRKSDEKEAEQAVHQEEENLESQQQLERRPSHTRGLSDITVQSDSTAVSQPTPEEEERWAREGTQPQRPLSP